MEGKGLNVLRALFDGPILRVRTRGLVISLRWMFTSNTIRFLEIKPTRVVRLPPWVDRSRFHLRIRDCGHQPPTAAVALDSPAAVDRRLKAEARTLLQRPQRL